MKDLLVAWLPWIRAFHIIAVIAWMAGMLYLPRLYVYHAGVDPRSEQSELFKVMERRLLRGIINPAMAMVFLFGILLLLTPGVVDFATDGWIHVKLTAVILLSAFHGFLARWRKDFAADRNTRSPGFYRAVNEIPTVLMIVIVIMVVVRPF
ncbi:MAG TPA: protoporphyrinogen oxidase HemJ [Sphingomonadales bacterium]